MVNRFDGKKALLCLAGNIPAERPTHGSVDVARHCLNGVHPIAYISHVSFRSPCIRSLPPLRYCKKGCHNGQGRQSAARITTEHQQLMVNGLHLKSYNAAGSDWSRHPPVLSTPVTCKAAAGGISSIEHKSPCQPYLQQSPALCRQCSREPRGI
jgi:hypothetical protein